MISVVDHFEKNVGRDVIDPGVPRRKPKMWPMLVEYKDKKLVRAFLKIDSPVHTFAT